MAENEFDPEDVIASTGVSLLVRVGSFLAAAFLGHGIGLLCAQFAKPGDLLVVLRQPPDPSVLLTAVFGSFAPTFFFGLWTFWLTPWLIAFLYFASQFLLDENGWRRWFPWLAGGQAVFSYLVLDNLGIGAVFLVFAVGSVVAGWLLLQAKLHEREMRRFEAIEAENRRKRKEKAQRSETQ